MRTLDIWIKSREQAHKEFIEAFEAARSGKKVTPTQGVFFTSLEAVRALLTEKRLALLHLIRERHPQSINQLANMAGRDFKNVHTDIMLLRHYGLVQMERRRRAEKTAYRRLSVPYQEINIHAAI